MLSDRVPTSTQPQQGKGLTEIPATDEKAQLVSGLFSVLKNDPDLAELVQAWSDLPDHLGKYLRYGLQGGIGGRFSERTLDSGGRINLCDQ